jgi:hypothetical protein
VGAVGSRGRAADGNSQASAEQIEFFETQIRPVLVEHCYECHAGTSTTLQGGLRLDWQGGMQRGGDSGALINAQSPSDSLLVRVMRYQDDVPQMPPDEPLPPEVIAAFERWISMGAPDPRGTEPASDVATKVAADWRDHWAFQPLRSPSRAVSEATQAPDKPATPLDRTIQLQQQTAGLTLSPPAPPRVQLRRVTYDLVGLPPTAERLDQLEASWSRETYERYVDELLASPQFGERWARHWLDVMRYADTKGYVFQEDRNYPDAYRYRDWVIHSLNDDMPYDRFVRLQLAADQLSEADPERDLVATGFVTLGRRFLNNRFDIIDDRIDVVCRGLMGLTVSCARCHDHKYDPIPTADYYSLFGVFNSSRTENKESLALLDSDSPADAHILVRGSPGNQGAVVPRQFLSALTGESRVPFHQGSGRLELAQAITDPQNPLTARVFVNRVWGQLFGSYLVGTPSDFGLRSEPPALPETLDYLAGQFIASGWSRKALIREIVMSDAYRQASEDRPDARAVDPENTLYWKANRRRMDFETLRDSMIQVAGQLQLEPLGGPSVHIESAPYPMRRTVYAFIDRQNLPGVFRTFDMANPDTHSPQRLETVVPQQALFLMNNPFSMELAEHVAQMTLSSCGATAHQAIDDPVLRDRAIELIYRCVLGRPATPAELQWTAEFFKSVAESNESSNSLELDESSADSVRWVYGYGSLELESGAIASFTPLEHWTGSTYQHSAQLPDPQTGWVSLNAQGGHPGQGPERVAVRRYCVPVDGTLRISGRLRHGQAEGDGVRGRIAVAGKTPVWQSEVHNREVDSDVESLEVKAGEWVDFAVDSIASDSHDSFTWTLRVQLRLDGATVRRDNSVEAFRGPAPATLGPWAQLAQVLMLSNEFVIVD